MPKVFLTATQRLLEIRAYRQGEYNDALNRRKSRGMDFQLLASLVGVSPTTLSKWKNDSGQMTLEHFRKLADVAQLTDDEIIKIVKGKA